MPEARDMTAADTRTNPPDDAGGSRSREKQNAPVTKELKVPETEISRQSFDYSGLPAKFAKDSQARAAAIRELDADAGRKIIDMGKVLKAQREAFGSIIAKKQARGTDTWDAWVKGELGWQSGRNHANRIIQIYEKFDGDAESPSLGFNVMRVLAADNTPEELVERVVELAERGELPTVKKVRDMKKDMAADRLPTPTEAKEIAKATGRTVAGSDGRYHTPMPEDTAADYEQRRADIYGALEAIKKLAGLDLTPAKWLGRSEDHWLIDFRLAEVDAAAKWLTALSSEYKSHLKVIDAQAIGGDAAP